MSTQKCQNTNGSYTCECTNGTHGNVDACSGCTSLPFYSLKVAVRLIYDEDNTCTVSIYKFINQTDDINLL